MVIVATQPSKVEFLGQNNDGQIRRFTIADGASVSKYDLLQLIDPRTVQKFSTAAVGTTNACAGLASEEHLPNIGVTSIGAFTDGIFEIQASAAIILGNPITFCLNNFVNEAPAYASSAILTGHGASIAGYSLETASAEEMVNVRIRL